MCFFSSLGLLDFRDDLALPSLAFLEMLLYKGLEVSEGRIFTLTLLSLSPHAEVFRGITL